MPPDPIVALIDDDDAVLDSLRMVLANRGIVAECFPSGDDFLRRLSALSLSCIVSDVRMPGLSGLALQRELTKRGIAVPLILITGHGDIAMAVSAIKAGAFDFVEKPFDYDALMESIRGAIEHRTQTRTQRERIAVVIALAEELPHRQRQVMHLVAQGLSSKEIALRLNISPRTVENYRAWVMEKMGANNLSDLVRMVVQIEQAGEGEV
jgi:two-component system response regulator FixJ